jgi:LuxR family maltose regulon positive regulatory protein
MLEQAERLYLPGFFPDTQPIAAALARVRISQGRLFDAWEWVKEQKVTAEDDATYRAEFNLLTLARLLVAHHHADEAHGDPSGLEAAIRLLDGLLTAAEAADRGGSIIEARLVRALAHQARGDHDAALTDLSHGLVQSAPGGYARLFLDEGPTLEQLLAAAAARTDLPGADRAADLIGAARGPSPPDQSPTSSGLTLGSGVLSDRELEVLRLLATDLTGPEIAAELFVSVNTLRTHTRHIFTKLDVNTRPAAVRRATELGLS